MLHMYVEAIIPDNYGIRKSCCFCFASCCRKRPTATNSVEAAAAADLEMSEINAAQAQTDLALDAKGGLVRRASTVGFNSQDPIQLKKVTMKFGTFKAVDQMSLSIRQNEIMALLGHNGAGKTTAIYMLTGMLHMTSGDATIYGKNVKREIDEVRKEIGLCQQLDVLYDLVSVEEHLKLTLRVRYGRIDPQ